MFPELEHPDQYFQGAKGQALIPKEIYKRSTTENNKDLTTQIHHVLITGEERAWRKGKVNGYVYWQMNASL